MTKIAGFKALLIIGSILGAGTAFAGSDNASWQRQQQLVEADPSLTFFGHDQDTQRKLLNREDHFKAVAFHDAAHSREWGLIQKLYSSYLSGHANISIKSAIVALNGQHTGSLILKFISPKTCVANSEKCLTNIVTYGSAIDGVEGPSEEKQWHEVFSRHTANLYVGGPSPQIEGFNGQNMSEVMGDDHVVWQWRGPSYGYYPSLLSLGHEATPWRLLRYNTEPGLKTKVFLENPQFFTPTDTQKNKAIFAYLQKNHDRTLVAVQYMGTSSCGQIGCPMSLFFKGKQTSNEWEDLTSEAPININDSSIAKIESDRMKPQGDSSSELPALAVQDANFISLWAFSNGQYRRYGRLLPVLPKEN